MYLLLVENNFIASREIKSMLDKNRIKCEIVNCSSSESLIDIAEKLSPEIVIIDFDFFIEDSAEIVRNLRENSEEVYILAFIDPDHYEKLHQAIEEGIDDYLVKPLQREDVMMRIKMGLQRKALQINQTVEDKNLIDDNSDDFFMAINSPVKPQYKEVEKTFFTSENHETGFEEQADSEALDTESFYDIPDLSSEETLSFESLIFEKPAREELQTMPEPEASETAETPEETSDIDNLFSEAEEYSFSENFLEIDSGLKPEQEPDYFDPDKSEAADSLFGSDFFSTSAEDSMEDERHEGEPDFGLAELEIVSEHQSGSSEQDNLNIITDLQESDDLFNEVSDLESTESFETTGESESNETGLTDLNPEGNMFHQEENPGKLDDLELFGVVKTDNNVNTKAFEELFGDTNDRKKKKAALSSEHKEGKQGKVEYLFPAKNPSEDIKAALSDKTERVFLTDEDKPVKTKANLTNKGHSESTNKGRFLRIFGNVLTALLLIIMVTMSLFLIQSRLGGGTPAVAGYRMYVVMSGSMSPAFDTGSLVFVKQTEPLSIAEGDIITYSSATDSERLTTHRVVGINRENGLNFVTRGDANNVNDPNMVAAGNLVGMVTGSVPYIGYLLGYAQTSQGLVLLIFIPGFLILLLELRRLLSYLAESKAQKSAAVSKTAVRHVGEEHKVKEGAAAGDFDFLSKSYQN